MPDVAPARTGISGPWACRGWCGWGRARTNGNQRPPWPGASAAAGSRPNARESANGGRPQRPVRAVAPERPGISGGHGPRSGLRLARTRGNQTLENQRPACQWARCVDSHCPGRESTNGHRHQHAGPHIKPRERESTREESRAGSSKSRSPPVHMGISRSPAPSKSSLTSQPRRPGTSQPCAYGGRLPQPSLARRRKNDAALRPV